MNLPLFRAHDDPGPRFTELLRRSGFDEMVTVDGSVPVEDYRHGTTCVAIRYANGVLLAGDRRATSGHLISHRSIEKVFPSDRHSGVAIAGAAGPAVEMVRLFQLQLEHYEKVEGTSLSLEGKANQLSQMIRNNLPAAMQGMAVVPIFAGFDLKREEGRLFEFDITGGRYEETDHASTGSGSLHAGTVVKLGYAEQMDAGAVTDLAIHALFEAADEDSATGGPDLVRGIYPVIATISADGYNRLDDDELAERTQALIAGRRRN
ncbi:MAG: proteasome subunit beta [Actinobacteria bacterium]|nr:proteasome subunit beta [Actinomycetota bacterium]